MRRSPVALRPIVLPVVTEGLWFCPLGVVGVGRPLGAAVAVAVVAAPRNIVARGLVPAVASVAVVAAAVVSKSCLPCQGRWP